MKFKERIPVTVLTGFLGAGKTTLLNQLLSQKHGYKCAIIINEFGPISIDNQLVLGADEEIVELNNGCLCCRVRGDLIKSLANLFKKQKRFDYVLVETTGLADPGPVAQTFFMPELAKTLRLDAIVTVVDAKHIETMLDEAPEAPRQIAFADVVLLNKTDLVAREELERLEERIHKMNSIAQIIRTKRAEIDFAKVLNIKARDLTAAADLGEAVVEHEHEHEHGHDGHGHGHEDDHEHHEHQDDVRSLYFSEERPLDLKKLEAWLSELLTNKGPQLYRSKGIFHIQGEPKRVVFQGVQMIFEAEPDRFWKPDETRRSQLVFIGKDLDEAELSRGFANCLA